MALEPEKQTRNGEGRSKGWLLPISRSRAWTAGLVAGGLFFGTGIMVGISSLDIASTLGPSQAELKAKAEAEAAERAQADRVACEKDQDRLASENTSAMHQNENMLKTTLDELARNGQADAGAGAYGWTVEIETLSATEWRWVEEETAVASNGYENGGFSDRISYTLDPRALSAHVVTNTYNGQPAIRFSCATKGCIRAVGRRVTLTNGVRGLVDIDERRDSNNWVVNSGTRASALTDVMGALLGNYRFKRRACPAPAP